MQIPFFRYPHVYDEHRVDIEQVVLAAGDSIRIPRYLPTVRVEGTVNSPASITCVRVKDIVYYIDAARSFYPSPNRDRPVRHLCCKCRRHRARGYCPRAMLRLPHGLVATDSLRRSNITGVTVFGPRSPRSSW